MSLRVAVLGQLPDALLAQLAELTTSLDLVILGQAPDAHAATASLMHPLPDIAVVSTTFADSSGFAFMRALPAAQRPVGLVFVGTRDEDAVTAFELQATDFVLWPAAHGRVHDAMGRARQQVLQLALLRTADELQRLIAEVGASGSADLSALLRARLGNGANGANGHTANGNGHAPDAGRKRRAVGGAATGTLVASTPWRAHGRSVEHSAPARSRDGQDEGVLDLSQEDGGRGGNEVRPLRVLVREGRRTRFVPLADVDWFEADGNYIRVHTGGEKYRTRGTITAIESALDPRQFVRIHRRIVVNMDRVREMSPLPGGDGLLVLGDGSTLRLSRTYRSRVR
ncbi:LytR/AlgR family response regulator transcription factor [Gemmatimonas sp.]